MHFCSPILRDRPRNTNLFFYGDFKGLFNFQALVRFRALLNISPQEATAEVGRGISLLLRFSRDLAKVSGACHAGHLLCSRNIKQSHRDVKCL